MAQRPFRSKRAIVQFAINMIMAMASGDFCLANIFFLFFGIWLILLVFGSPKNNQSTPISRIVNKKGARNG